MATSEKGILAILLDFNFDDFVTKKLIKFLYMIGFVVASIIGLAVMASGFSQGVLVGLLSLLIAPVVGIMFIALVRIQLELIMVVFRIADHARIVADAARANGSSAAG